MIDISCDRCEEVVAFVDNVRIAGTPRQLRMVFVIVQKGTGSHWAMVLGDLIHNCLCDKPILF